MYNKWVKFKWDPEKVQVNLDKHGVSFEDATTLWEKDAVIVPARTVEEEERFYIAGFLGDKLFTCFFTFRGDVVRIFSLRRSRTKEEKRFYEESKKNQEINSRGI